MGGIVYHDDNEYAIIDKATGKVVNMIVWDGKGDYKIDDGCIAIKADPYTPIAIGYTYNFDDGNFTAPDTSGDPKSITVP